MPPPPLGAEAAAFYAVVDRILSGVDVEFTTAMREGHASTEVHERLIRMYDAIIVCAQTHTYDVASLTPGASAGRS